MPGTYFRPPYIGVSGWVGVELVKLDEEQLKALMHESFQFVTRKKAASGRSKSGSPSKRTG